MKYLLILLAFGLPVLAQKPESTTYHATLGLYENSQGGFAVFQQTWRYDQESYEAELILKVFDGSGREVAQRAMEEHASSYPQTLFQEGDMLWVAFSYPIYTIWQDGETPSSRTDILQVDLLSGQLVHSFSLDGMAHQLQRTADGGFLATWLLELDLTKAQLWLGKVDRQGSLLWSQLLGTNSYPIYYYLEKSGAWPRAALSNQVIPAPLPEPLRDSIDVRR